MTAASPNEHPSRDLYQVLGVTPSANSAEITLAYRRLARRYHPDVDTTPGATHRFAEITHAFRVLSDPGARARYDATRAPRRTRTPTASHHGPWSPWTASRTNPGRTRREAIWLGGPSLANAFHLGFDLPSRSVENEEAELELTIEESYHGTTRTVTVTSHDRTESVHVDIPPGVIDGDRIEVKTTHLPGGRDTPAVFLRVRLAPHERYELGGRDLHVRLPLSPWEAALGSTIAFETPAGPIDLDVPAGTCTGHELTLPGCGLPNPAGPAGHLYVHAHIDVPAKLTQLERDLFRRLATTSTFNPRTTTASQP